MSICRLSTLTALAIAICASPIHAEEQYADDYHDGTTRLASYATVAAMSRQIAELETQLASLKGLESRLAAFENGGCDANGASCGCDGGCGCDTGCGNCCESCCDSWMSPCRGLTGMAEVIWLRPQDTFSDSGINDFQHGSRFTVGLMNECAREWRLRYFELGLNSPIDNFINLYTVDVEYAPRFQLCNLDGQFSLGLRYADWHESATGAFGGLNFEDSIGPVIGVQLQTDIWNNLDLFAIGRYSHQFGHPVGLGLTLGSFTVTELSIGLQYNRDLASGTAFLRGAFEAQNWAVNTDTSDEDMGFVGLGLALGFTR